MNIFGIGGGEFFVIIILALIVFGPGKLPELMGDAGRMLRELRRSTRDLTSDFEGSMKDIQDAYREVESDMRSTMRQIQTDTKEISDDINTTFTGATEFGKGSSKSKAAAAAASASEDGTPLDQQFEAETAKAPAVQKAFPNGKPKPAAAPKTVKAKPAPQPVEEDLLAVSDDVDDLLAAEDADDLLSASASDESGQSAAD